MTTKPATRRTAVRLPRARRVSDILRAARAVFTERGFENASMAEIAERAGVVEGTIYKYFDNKRDLLNRVMTRWYEEMLVNFEDELAGIRGTRNRLRFIIWRHLRSIEDNPALCRVFFREIRASDDYTASTLYDLNRRYTRYLVNVLRGGVKTGDVRPDVNVALVRDMVFGAVEHHTWKYVCGKGGLDSHAVADELADMVLRGIAAEPRPAQDGAPLLERMTLLVERLEQATADITAPPTSVQRRAR